MKKVTYLFLFFTLCISSQNLLNVDKIVNKYSKVNSIEELAKKIDSDFKTDIEKVRATYTWLALNIRYYKKNSHLLKAPAYIVYTDKEDLARRKKKQNEKLVLKTFKTRNAVCEGYALSFKRICDLLQIDNELVKGYVKTMPYQITYVPKEKNHVWNAVKINNSWLYFDVTFGAGTTVDTTWKQQLNLNYFNIRKEKLNLTHYPSDEKWRKIMNQKSLKNFCFEPIYTNKFLTSRVELLNPVLGEISIKKGNKIHLNLKNLDIKTKILYKYNTSNFGRKPSMNYSNNTTQLVIKSPKKNSELGIYFDNKLALVYNVIVE